MARWRFGHGYRVGIAPEDQMAVFEEFRQVGTASKKVEGTGLGLASHESSSNSMVEESGSKVRSGLARPSPSRCR
jgi:signal transduction histidine kinase